MDDQVFRAILALDSYNRGYHPGIANLDSAVGSFVGDAKIIQTDGQQDASDIGFYAVAYEWDGQTVISYRGTDEIPNLLQAATVAGNDAVYGWPLGAGEFDVCGAGAPTRRESGAPA